MKKWIAWILIGLMLLAAGCSNAKNTLDWDAIVEEAATETSEDEDIMTEEPEEDLADPFAFETVAASPDEPVAAVGYIGGWGYINLSGQWVIAPQYDMAYPFVDNVATVQLQTGEWQLIDKSGAVLAQFPGDIQVFEPMLPHIYPGAIFDSGCTIFDGMIIICKDVDQNGVLSWQGADLFGYADIAGNIVVEPQYHNAGAFGDGLAPVDVGRPETNASGKTVILPHIGYIDKTGNMVIEPKYSYADRFSDGMAIIQTDEDYPESGYIDTTGALRLTTDHYQYPFVDFKAGIALILTRDGAGVVDKTGTVLGEVAGAEMQTLEFSRGMSLNYGDGFSDGLFPLFDVSMEYDADTGFYPVGFINTKGEFAIPAQTEWKVCQGFSNGLCMVYQGEGESDLNRKYGYIDTAGALVTPLMYSDGTMFQYDRAIVKVEEEVGVGKWYIIDKSGQTVAELGDMLLFAQPFTK
ncbi:hypothetical protein SDC9_65426 [bioreactor metagenome]|uniref:WG repeat-containing protein n=1 Tax=bioreactor metagenome TaxID=1076179 RepID=A0A644XTB9_9ZZZZ